MKNTTHKVNFGSSVCMSAIADCSVDLVVTSPPYPMIEMWDEIMSLQNPEIGVCLQTDPSRAFELIHQELDKVWKECFRVLKDGGFLCINVGDATRTINGHFQLYNNHSRIVSYCLELGFCNLPNILWRKPTNSPNKFMGSGMLPCGAYVTLEHEWIIVMRKGGKRDYKKEADKQLRQESAFFWEERNIWFSDVWEVKGTKQKISNSLTRERNASFPVSIPYRLICMYSQYGDTVLDPFFGLGTTSVAAMIAGRNSIGYEIDKELRAHIADNIGSISVAAMTEHIADRYRAHLAFAEKRIAEGKEIKYVSEKMGCPVMTKQEVGMALYPVRKLRSETDASGALLFHTEYADETIDKHVLI